MTETFEKILGSVANGELDKMVKSDDLYETITGFGIVYSLNVAKAIEEHVAKEIDDARTD